eukprot:g2626.t1
MKNFPLILAGPSGVGKGTLSKMLFKCFPNQFALSVSHTTRSPREGEVNGVHYHFVDVQEMERAISAGEFVESCRVHKNLYGTSFKAIESASKEKICLLDIDIGGCKKLKKTGLKTRGVFILPPSMDSLEKRLRGRNTESEETLKTRLGAAKLEIEYGKCPGNFDVLIVNDDLEKAFQELRIAVKKFYPHLIEASNNNI